ncbi:MAG: sugar ABC transporter substrate-binding protein [Chloroflexi bacterium]|nr:sugar ABC transporter substrate-binding protein [Chloroflexota bacterium]
MTPSKFFSRREFLRLAGVTAAGAALAACAPVPQQAPAMPTTAPPSKVPVEIVYAFHDPADFRKEAVEAFNRQFADIKITLQQIPDEFPTKVFTMAAAGTLPDVVRVWEPHVLDFGRSEQVIDLQPFVDKQADFNIADFIESFHNFPVIKGKRYGIADGWNGHLCFYNKGLFDKASVKYPDENWNWDDYVAIAQKISKPAEKIWGSDGLFIGWLHWSYKLVWQNGGQVYSEDYTKCLLDSAEAIEGLQFWADQLLKGEIMPSPAQAEGMGDMFQTGRAAMQRVGTWVMGALAEGGKFAWDMVPEPKRKVRRTLLHTAFNVIPKTTKDKDNAWKWLNFIVGPEGQYLYVKKNATPGTRRSVNARKPWAREGVAAHWDYVPQAGEYGILVPAPPNVGEVEKIQGDAVQAIFLGKAKAKEVLPDVAKKVTETLGKPA